MNAEMQLILHGFSTNCLHVPLFSHFFKEMREKKFNRFSTVIVHPYLMQALFREENISNFASHDSTYINQKLNGS